MGSATTWAADINAAAQLEVNVQAELRVTERNGDVERYRYIPARHFAQGQELYYTVRIRNAGTHAIKEAIVVQPVPANTHYIAHSAMGAGALIGFSVDGGKTFAAAEELKPPDSSSESNENSTIARVSQDAAPMDYTHIRWQLRHPLEPGAVVLARFRVVFD